MRGDDANQTGFHVFVNQRDARSLYRSTARGCYYRPVLILVKVRGFIRSGRNNLGLFTGGDESKGEIWKEQRLVRIVKEGKR